MYAFSEMVDHVALLRELYGPFVDLPPGVHGFGNCEIPSIHPKKEGPIVEKYVARDSSGIEKSRETKELDNVKWPPGLENPADGIGTFKTGNSSAVAGYFADELRVIRFHPATSLLIHLKWGNK